MDQTQDIIKSNISLNECYDTLKNLSNQSCSFLHEIPDAIKKDYDTFIIGKTLSSVEDRIITYDVKDYIKKIMSKGFDYPIQWVNNS
ncbi:MAG: hypothetical protein IPL98_17605 [Saprospiraceae bacterium]|jgi:hypothetical protein|nr:hypothetical protein [Saprospiraceae bacterium]